MKPFSCPRCGSKLAPLDPDRWGCPADGLEFPRIDGIWRFLAPETERGLTAFVRDYEAVRAAEGRGSDDPQYYRALPFQDLSGTMPEMWRMRAASYRTFQRRVVQGRPRPQRVLDLGAGNGWLSYRLALDGHEVDAVDLLVNARDGLGAHIHYDAAFRPIQAAFDALPLRGSKYDLVVFNAAFHYAPDYDQTLAHVLRRLDAGGALVIMDTPVYQRVESGIRMVHERAAEFKKRYGFASDSRPMENFLTDRRLHDLAGAFDLQLRQYHPRFGLRRRLLPLIHRLRRRREPARFPLIVLSRKA